jgi:hypothetical protein
MVLSGSSTCPTSLAALCAFVWTAVAVAAVPTEARNSIDRITGAKGSYIANEGAVLSVVLDSGLEATGLGSLSLFEKPRVMSLDIMGVGDFQKLASSFRKALDQIRKQRSASPQPRWSDLGSSVPVNSNIDPSRLRKK